MLGKLLPRNEHVVDRALRVVAGVALLAMALTGTLGAWAWIGVVPLFTGLVGSCPLYTLLGVGTCPIEPKQDAGAS